MRKMIHSLEIKKHYLLRELSVLKERETDLFFTNPVEFTVVKLRASELEAELNSVVQKLEKANSLVAEFSAHAG